jgi:alkanesulfonate monooxygenase SsuD/methylene tetrahydromethanopterin reductase-like flavin-dependent oxidoreductase (luciferase family)
VADKTDDRSALPGDNEMKLGTFCLNISGGMMMSTAAKSALDWQENVAVAQAADSAGWEFLLPLGRWRGQGGANNSNAEQYETFTWAAAIAAVTERIQVFTTCHVPIFHPMLAAKMGATIDNISSGRFGMNIVAGWNELEFGMFGIQQQPHDDRYAAAAEWLDIIQRLWTENDELDYQGRYYTVSRGYLQPKPIQSPRPLVVSAGTSSTGLDFALTHADYTFQGGPDWESLEGTAQRSQERSKELGSTAGLLAFSSIVVKDTEREAQRYFEWYVDECGDLDGARALIERVVSGGARSLPPEVMRQQVRGWVAGYSALPLIGTAEQIVDQLTRYKKIGYGGVALGWLDYSEGIQRFNAEVLPLMKEAGLRR